MYKFIVIGEHCLDVQVFGSCDKICRDGPVPQLVPDISYDDFTGMIKGISLPMNIRSNYSQGLAGNVTENLKAISYNRGIEIVSIGEHPSQKAVKVRFFDEVSGHILLRVDYDAKAQDKFSDENYREQFRKSLIDADAVMISDYDQWFLTLEDLGYISDECRNACVPCYIDTRKPVGALAGMLFSLIKINEAEFRESMDIDRHSTRSLTNLIVTMGAHGTAIPHTHIHRPVNGSIQVRDVVGAGDGHFAMLVFLLTTTTLPLQDVILDLCNEAGKAICQNHSPCLTKDQVRDIDAERHYSQYN